jgi:hypothetical protein
MRSLLGLFLVLLLSACSDSEVAAAQAQSARDLLPQRHGFGTVLEGMTLFHTFRMTNDSDTSLLFQALQRDCSCTVASASVVTRTGAREPLRNETPLQPGQTLEVQLAFDTLGKKGFAQAKTLVVFGDAAEPVPLLVDAEVVPFVSLDPAPLELGSFPTAESRAGSISITSPAVGLFKLAVDASGLPAEVQVELLPTAAEISGLAEAWSLQVAVGPNAPEFEHYFCSIPLTCTWPSANALPAEVRARLPNRVVATVVAKVTSSVYPTPAYLAFGQMSRSAVASTTARISAAYLPEMHIDDANVRIVDPEGVPAERVTFELQRIDSAAYDLTVTVAPGQTTASVFRGVVAVSIADHELRIPYFGLLVD